MGKKAFTVRIDESIDRELEKRARELGISKTKLVEMILAEYIGKEEAETPLKLIELLRTKVMQLENRVTRLEEAFKGMYIELVKMRASR